MTDRTAEERQLLYNKTMEVNFYGQSGPISFRPDTGDRLPIKLEIVNIHVGERWGADG